MIELVGGRSGRGLEKVRTTLQGGEGWRECVGGEMRRRLVWTVV